MSSKNVIAHRMYDGVDFEDLMPGEKASVTKKFNAQGSGARKAPRRVAGGSFVTAQVGRVDDNGNVTCTLSKGKTVSDLLTQAEIDLDEDKEGVIAQSTGDSVNLSDEVKDGEIYVIAPEIKSAF